MTTRRLSPVSGSAMRCNSRAFSSGTTIVGRAAIGHAARHRERNDRVGNIVADRDGPVVAIRRGANEPRTIQHQADDITVGQCRALRITYDRSWRLPRGSKGRSHCACRRPATSALRAEDRSRGRCGKRECYLEGCRPDDGRLSRPGPALHAASRLVAQQSRVSAGLAVSSLARWHAPRSRRRIGCRCSR